MANPLFFARNVHDGARSNPGPAGTGKFERLDENIVRVGAGWRETAPLGRKEAWFKTGPGTVARTSRRFRAECTWRDGLFEALGARSSSGPVALGLRLNRRRWQDIVDSDPAELLPIDHNGDCLSHREIHARPVTLWPRFGVDLDLAIDHIDDPVHGTPDSP